MILINFFKVILCLAHILRIRRALSEEEINDLKSKIVTDNYTKPVKVWAYNAKSLELVNSLPFPSIGKAAKYFHILENRIARHLDTKLATIHKGEWIYFFY